MVNDVLGIKGRENVFFVFLNDARCEPVAEFLADPILVEGLEGLRLGGGQGGKMAVQLQAGKGADADVQCALPSSS